MISVLYKQTKIMSIKPWLFLLLLTGFLVLNTHQTNLNIKETTHVSLEINQTASYAIKIPSGIPSKQDLYIRAEPIIPNPLQNPHLVISEHNGYSTKCFSALATFSSICRIPSSQLLQNRIFNIKVSCSVQCDLTLGSYLSSTYSIQMGREATLSAQQNDFVALLQVQIPKDAKYTSLIATAFITNLQANIEMGNKGLTMFINYGSYDISDPTDQDFVVESEQLFSGGRVAFLDGDKVVPGTLVKFYITIAKGMRVVFSVTPHDGQQQIIELGRSIFDLAKVKEGPKLYQIDTNQVSQNIENQTIELVFDFYSGSPLVTIGFDESFSKSMAISRSRPSISIELTPELRQLNQFNNTLMIKVDCPQTCQYYFYSQVVNQQVSLLRPYTTYFDQLALGQIYNYIFDERVVIDPAYKQSSIKNYTFKLENTQGNGSLFVRRCKQIEISNVNFQSLDACIVKDKATLDSYDFVKEQIQTKMIQAGHLTDITLSYDINQCPIIKRQKKGIVVRQCAFQIVVTPDSKSTQPWIYNIQLERKYHASYLREGKLTKEYLSKNSYAFFAFALPDYSEVSDLVIFSTTYSGDTVLLVSQKDPYPTLESTDQDLRSESGTKNTIRLINKEESPLGQIYIGVYANSFAEVNVGVVVNRKGYKGTTKINLQAGNNLLYTLDKQQKDVHFKIEISSVGKVVVDLNQIVGLVQMQILDINETQVECVAVNPHRSSCEFVTKTQGQAFTIVVSGRYKQEQQFSIGFVEQSDCKKALLNSPTFVTLNGYIINCYTVDVNRAVPLQFMTSLTPMQILQKQVEVLMKLNDEIVGMIGPDHYEITLRSMIEQCHFGFKNKTDDFAETCRVTFHFVSLTNRSKELQFILQEQKKEMALFDGVAIPNPRIDVNQQEPLNFYYKISSVSPIKIFGRTQSNAIDFYLSAKLVSQNDFIHRGKSNDSIYPSYLSREERSKEEGNNIFFTQIAQVATAVLSISINQIKNLINTNHQHCYLLISVYPDGTDLQNKINYQNSLLYTDFNIEVMQTQTTLELGQTKNGYISMNGYEAYVVRPEKALVYLRNMDQYGSKNQPCATLSAALPNGTIFKSADIIGGSLQLNQEDQVEYIYVKGTESTCSYQITYLSLEMPLSNAKLSQPYDLVLTEKQTRHFIYYHANPVTFKIVKLIGAGTLDAYILPMDNRQRTLKQALNININEFPIIDKDQRQLIVKESSEHFCFDCFYLVVVTTTSSFDGEIIFLRNKDPIPLTTNHILKQWLVPESEFSQEQYIYYSLTDFNFTIDVITGSVNVVVIDPKGKHIFAQVATKKTTLQVISDVTQQDSLYYSSKTKYTLKVKAIIEAQFYISVNKFRITERIFEGLPATFQLTESVVLSVQFINSQDLKTPLSLMVTVDTHIDSLEDLKFTFSGQYRNGSLVQDGKSLMLNKTASGKGSYIFSLKNFKGSYFMSVLSKQKINITVVLLNKALTHLVPHESHLFNTEGVYQLFTNSQNVLVEVFNCQGDFYLLASKDIKDTQASNTSESPISLRRPNYAGHYVIGVQGIFGSYFMRVNSKTQGQPVEYLIKYSYYNEMNPYDVLDANNFEITYEEGDQEILVKYHKLNLLPEGQERLQVAKISYQVYASYSKFDLRRQSRCGIRGQVIEKQVQNDAQVYLQKSLLQKIENKEESNSIYLTVEAMIQLKHLTGTKQTSQHSIFYNTLQMPIVGSKDYKYFFTDSLLILAGWLILPFILALIIVFYLLRFCIRRIMKLRGHLVEEQVQIVAASNPTLPSNSKLAAGEPRIDHPDSAATQIKEHI